MSEPSKEKPAEEQGSASKGQAEDENGSSLDPDKKAKKPGRQPGMAGHSRSPSLAVSGEMKHIPAYCVVCGTSQSEENFLADKGHLTVNRNVNMLDRKEMTMTFIQMAKTEKSYRKGQRLGIPAHSNCKPKKKIQKSIYSLRERFCAKKSEISCQTIYYHRIQIKKKV